MENEPRSTGNKCNTVIMRNGPQSSLDMTLQSPHCVISQFIFRELVGSSLFMWKALGVRGIVSGLTGGISEAEVYWENLLDIWVRYEASLKTFFSPTQLCPLWFNHREHLRIWKINSAAAARTFRQWAFLVINLMPSFIFLSSAGSRYLYGCASNGTLTPEVSYVSCF